MEHKYIIKRIKDSWLQNTLIEQSDKHNHVNRNDKSLGVKNEKY